MEDAEPLDVIPVEQPQFAAGAPENLSVLSVQAMAAPRAGAVQQGDRIQSIDVLRGFALLGILVMNIQSFAMIEAAYSNPTAYGNLEGANYWVWLMSHVLADQKFMTIFSMLFGAGVVLMTSRQEEATGKSAAVHYRRMGSLALFGLLHAYLLWYGDILFSYAACGLLVYLFRRLRPWLLCLLGGIAITLPALLLLLGGLILPPFFRSLPPEKQEAIKHEIDKSWHPSPEQADKEISAYLEGWASGFQFRWRMAIVMQTFGVAFFTLWRAGGLMLIGMALFKSGVFSAERSTRFYLALIAAAVFVGVPLILLEVHRNENSGWNFAQAELINGQFNYWASIVVSLGWVGVIMLWCKHAVLARLAGALGAVGQMAFTNYLLHTLICTTIFYGYGFGLFGSVERVGQIGIVIAVWTFQLIMSPIWLHFFRFGPAEWLWRTMTYLRWQPMFRT
jgi:uncharacterized protein